MRDLWAYVQMIFAGLGVWLGWVLGGYDGFLYALVAFIVVDYLTGVMCAFVERRLSSDIGFRGIAKKVLIFTLVGIGHILDSQVIGNGGAIRTAIIFFYLSNEGLSILENTAKMGLPIPDALVRVLAGLKGSDADD